MTVPLMVFTAPPLTPLSCLASCDPLTASTRLSRMTDLAPTKLVAKDMRAGRVVPAASFATVVMTAAGSRPPFTLPRRTRMGWTLFRLSLWMGSKLVQQTLFCPTLPTPVLATSKKGG